jgi:hypothetical protein
MTLIKRFLLALALPLFLASHSNAQVSTTGDLIQNNAWTGCWTPTVDGFWGGTSGGPCPGISESGYAGSNQIIFSYQQQTISQTTALANALPNSGTGLQVNGYNWHWHVKNSNINDGQPGGYDTTAYVTVDLLSASGSILESDKYDYGYRISDWINPSGTRTYTNPYSLASADSIRLSLTGKDDGFWAGYWGPEFMHVTLNVNYSVDPCYDNPFYSPTCPGFAEALAKLTAEAMPTSEDTTGMPEVTQYGNNSTSSVPMEETTVTATPTVDAGGIEVSTTGELTIPGDTPKEKPVVEEAKQEEKPKPQVDYSLIAMVVRQATDLTNVMSVVNQSIMQSTESQVPASSSSAEEIAITTESVTTTQESPVNNVVTSQDNNNQQTTVAVETKTTQQTTVQQTRTQPNEAASGGVSMNDFAKAPADFSAYQTQLADAAFYAPKEIYRGQVNVDNRRAMRGLGSDRLHQEMVRQQYQ